MDDAELELDFRVGELEKSLPDHLLDLPFLSATEDDQDLSLAFPRDLAEPAEAEPSGRSPDIGPPVLFTPGEEREMKTGSWELDGATRLFPTDEAVATENAAAAEAELEPEPEVLFTGDETSSQGDKVDVAAAGIFTDPDGDEVVPGHAETGVPLIDPASPSEREAKLRLLSPRRGGSDQRSMRLAAAAAAACTLLGIVWAATPGREGGEEVETVLPRPTVTTLDPPGYTPLSPLLPVPVDQPAAAAPDTSAPGAEAGPPAGGRAPAGAAAPLGVPRLGATPASGGALGPAPSSSQTAPRTASSPAPAPPPLASAPPPPLAAAPAPAPAPAPEPEPEPARRDRRSETTVAETTTTTQAPPPTTQPTWVEPAAPRPAAVTAPPTTAAPPSPPPTTAQPPPATSAPGLTRPCFDGTPPRPVPC